MFYILHILDLKELKPVGGELRKTLCGRTYTFHTGGPDWPKNHSWNSVEVMREEFDLWNNDSVWSLCDACVLLFRYEHL